MRNEKTILLFDGECEFCNFWVQFIQKRKPKVKMLYLPLQSSEGEQYLKSHQVHSSVDSIVFIWKNKAYTKSNAAFQIVRQLGGVWKLLFVFWLVPRPLRDWVYDLIAKNRKRFFITKKDCEIH